MMRRPHQLPVLKLSEASAHVGARYREGFRDVLGGQRIHRKVQQCMNLRHSTVQAPSAAHFAPVKDELACHSRESHKRSFVYCYFGIYRNLQKKQRGWQREGRPSAATNPWGAARGRGDDRPPDPELHPVRAAGRDEFTRDAERAGV